MNVKCKLRNLLYRILRKLDVNNEEWKKQAQLGENNYFGDSFHVRFDNMDKERAVKKDFYLTIGSSNILYGNMIFENKTGHISIGNGCYIGGGSSIISINSIEIGDDVTISYGVTVYDHNSHSIYWDERKDDTNRMLEALNSGSGFIKNKDWSGVKSAPVKINDKVWIGFGSSIMKGVTIGEGSVVAANSVVVKDVPPYTVVGGNPAIVIKKIERNE